MRAVADGAGLIVQPIVGTLSDSCTLRMGRRKPFIVAGGAVCVLSLLLFGYCTDVAAVFAQRGGPAHSKLAIVLAVTAVWLIDFSVNVVRMRARSIRLTRKGPSCRSGADRRHATARASAGRQRVGQSTGGHRRRRRLWHRRARSRRLAARLPRQSAGQGRLRPRLARLHPRARHHLLRGRGTSARRGG